MAIFENLNLSLKEHILRITINRPAKMNALNVATMEEIRLAMQEAYDNPEVQGVLFTGEGGKAFVAGADIAEIAGLNEVSSRKFAEQGQETFAMIENCPKPVLAAINGYALGGGCELAMACHLRVAIVTAKFGQPEINLGVMPGYGGTQRLTQLIGKAKAMELIMTGELIPAMEAKALGLVNYVVDSPEELQSRSEELLKKILSKAPLAIEMIISCVNAVYNKDENGYQTEANSFSICCKSEDFKEGTKAFLEKRQAVFQGK